MQENCSFIMNENVKPDIKRDTKSESIRMGKQKESIFISYLRIENRIRKGNFIDQATNPIHCNKKFRFPEVPLF